MPSRSEHKFIDQTSEDVGSELLAAHLIWGFESGAEASGLPWVQYPISAFASRRFFIADQIAIHQRTDLLMPLAENQIYAKVEFEICRRSHSWKFHCDHERLPMFAPGGFFLSFAAEPRTACRQKRRGINELLPPGTAQRQLTPFQPRPSLDSSHLNLRTRLHIQAQRAIAPDDRGTTIALYENPRIRSSLSVTCTSFLHEDRAKFTDEFLCLAHSVVRLAE
jgi:hypothetical protein